jgi:hypothetical protein
VPDLTKCTRYKGALYCWDTEKNEIVEIHVNPVPVSPAYKDIVAAVFGKTETVRKEE